LDDHFFRNSVALWTQWFAPLEKGMQQMLLLEIIRAKELLLVVGEELPIYCIPFTTELPKVVEEVLGDVKICKFVMMLVLRIGWRAWSTCKQQAVDSDTNPWYGLKAQECPWSKN
jgi:hypothetical protein